MGWRKALQSSQRGSSTHPPPAPSPAHHYQGPAGHLHPGALSARPCRPRGGPHSPFPQELRLQAELLHVQTARVYLAQRCGKVCPPLPPPTGGRTWGVKRRKNGSSCGGLTPWLARRKLKALPALTTKSMAPSLLDLALASSGTGGLKE